MSSKEDFSPDWTSPPGDTITDILEERDLSREDFADSLGESLEFTLELLEGRTSITSALAQQLSEILGASESFWLNREAQFRRRVTDLERELDLDTLATKTWLGEIPVKDMMRFGWVPEAASPSERAVACLRFFGVPSVEAWRERCKEFVQRATFRTSRTFESDPGAVAAWIRQGELRSASIACGRWNPEAVRAALPELRSLTREKDLEAAVGQLKKTCAECGIAVAIVRGPAKCRASGAARILARGRRLVILSFRHLSDDHVWFTFFHELGHLLLHGEKGMFIDGEDSVSTKEEEEANTFAATTLIPREHHAAMLRLPANGRTVMRFAREVGVSPGIVVGQLQHRGRIRQNQLNNLKRPFNWEADEERD
jgi:plasmid maintenance system antidote protein VapI